MSVYFSIDANIDFGLNQNLDRRTPNIFTQNVYTLNLSTIHTGWLVGFPAHTGLENEVSVGSSSPSNAGKWKTTTKIPLKK